MAALLIAVSLLGCSPDACGTGGCDEDSTATKSEDTAAMVFSLEDPDPLWTADDVGALLADFVSLGAPNPVDIAYAYIDVMAEGDPTCPGSATDLGQVIGCTTEDGHYYSGIGWFDIMDRMTTDDGQTVPITWYHGGDFEIIRPTGERFAGGGDLKYETDLETGQATTSFTVAGTWVDETRIDWLGASYSGVYTGVLYREAENSSLTLNGGIGVGDYDLNLVDMVWDSAGTCAGAPLGTVQIRDPRGYWYSWTLDDDCDACGPVVFHQDQELGELCLDLTEWGHNIMMQSTPR